VTPDPESIDAAPVLHLDDIQELIDSGRLQVMDGYGQLIDLDYKDGYPCPNPFCDDGELWYENVDEYGYPHAGCSDCGVRIEFTRDNEVLEGGDA